MLKILLCVFPQCPLQQFPPVKDVVDVLPKLKTLALGDRAVYEKGMKAFVSYVQAYAKHECSLIFRMKGKQPIAKKTCFFKMHVMFTFLWTSLLQIWILLRWLVALLSSDCPKCLS